MPTADDELEELLELDSLPAPVAARRVRERLNRRPHASMVSTPFHDTINRLLRNVVEYFAKSTPDGRRETTEPET